MFIWTEEPCGKEVNYVWGKADDRYGHKIYQTNHDVINYGGRYNLSED